MKLKHASNFHNISWVKSILFANIFLRIFPLAYKRFQTNTTGLFSFVKLRKNKGTKKFRQGNMVHSKLMIFVHSEKN